MVNNSTDNQEPITVEAMLRQAAFEAWVATREEHQHDSREFFDRAYLGHYNSLDHYVESLVDDYGLDAKLDAAIAAPFREFVDIDIPGLARSLVPQRHAVRHPGSAGRGLGIQRRNRIGKPRLCCGMNKPSVRTDAIPI